MLRSAAVRIKRQPPMGLALFLCLAITACSPTESTGACTVDVATLEKSTVAAVIDGDTLRLRGGEKVRVIGINTPELGRDGRADEPLAGEARQAMRQLVDASGAVWLQDGRERRDRHGRRLAHVFDAGGNSLSAELLERGLGFQVAVSPNFAYVDCLGAAEAVARDAGAGVWAEREFAPLAAADLRPFQRGFIRLRDEVTHVSFKDNGWWIQLGGKVGVRIKRSDQALFSQRELAALDGREVEVRGWLVSMDDDWWMMSLGHPAMFDTVNFREH